MKHLKTCMLSLLVLLLCGFVLAGCGNDSAPAEDDAQAANADAGAATEGSEKTTITLGASAESIPLVESVKEPLQEAGYTVEIVSFDDFFVPNAALAEGSIDANLYQHEIFLDSYNEGNGTDLIMLEPKVYNFFTGLYSKAASSIEDLPAGGKIGIPNDASNIDHDLRLLEEWGLITLKEGVEQYTPLDIVDNPKGFEFVQLDYAQRIAALDELAAMTCGSNTVFTAGLNPNENLLAQSDDPEYALGVCIRPEDQDQQWVADMMAAFTSQEARDYVQEAYQGAFFPLEDGE